MMLVSCAALPLLLMLLLMPRLQAPVKSAAALERMVAAVCTARQDQRPA
jgi:hypothetical protein